ncbi:MAG: MDR family oxidoreductase [Cellvibrionaceae bacterium]
MFKAIQINKNEDYTAAVVGLDEQALPDGDVCVKVSYSTLNYKDALAITGKGPVIRQFPMVPGIDFSGVVMRSADTRYKEGDRVVLNGWGVGESHWGGLAEYAQVKADWLLPLPDGLTLKDAMGLGTAGYTAMLCVQALVDHGITADQGDILVTGAVGGVGSVAIYLLAQRGYRVVAASGRSTDKDYLINTLGAVDVIDRAQLNAPGKPLQKERWAGAVDVVGSHTLANICASLKYSGAVAACGLAQGMDLPASVAPFILRGITLLGIDSVYCPVEKRRAAWASLAEEMDVSVLSAMTMECSLNDVIERAEALLAGQVRGRVIVKL